MTVIYTDSDNGGTETATDTVIWSYDENFQCDYSSSRVTVGTSTVPPLGPITNVVRTQGGGVGGYWYQEAGDWGTGGSNPYTRTSRVELSDPIADFKAALLSNLNDRINKALLDFLNNPGGHGCISKLEVRSISSDYEFLDDCYDPPVPLEIKGTVARYRFGVPENFSTPEAPRSVWEMQWDEMTATTEWWEWFDGGMVGAEPGSAPVLVEKDWTWGGDMEEPWSEWFILPLPEEPGECRVMNVLVTCYHSSRLGEKPTACGPSYSPPPP